MADMKFLMHLRFMGAVEQPYNAFGKYLHMTAVYLACGCDGIVEWDLISFVVEFILLEPVVLVR